MNQLQQQRQHRHCYYMKHGQDGPIVASTRGGVPTRDDGWTRIPMTDAISMVTQRNAVPILCDCGDCQVSKKMG